VQLPFERSYWVDPGKLLAGPYPGEYDPHDTERNIRALLGCGIRCFINLMEGREEGRDAAAPSSYVRVVETAAARLGVEWDWQRFEIHDISVPDEACMDDIQRAIDASLARDRPVYAHCWRGRGRTGTVAGAYLIRRGMATPENFVEVIASLRTHDPLEAPSPETAEQIEFVRSWSRRAADL
jgi:hypothetical protein